MKTKTTRKNNKQGISLIVLVITIIVMVILAGAIILTLNNNGIINKASDAVEKTNLKQVQQLASLAWAEAYADGVTTVEDVDGVKGFKTRIEESLKAQKINLDEYTITVTDTGVEVALNSVVIVPPSIGDDEESKVNIIPEGATYTTGAVWVTGTEDSPPYLNSSNTITYTAGQEFPETPQILDMYIYGDYVYVYSATWMMPPNRSDNTTYSKWGYAGDKDFGNNHYEGWQVGIASDFTKTSYGEILESINGKPVMSMEYTFDGLTNLTAAPTIPGTVVNMFYTFAGCESLKGAITINATPTKYSACLSGTQVTQILGDCQVKDEILATK